MEILNSTSSDASITLVLLKLLMIYEGTYVRGDVFTSKASERSRVTAVIENYLQVKGHEYSKNRFYPESVVRKQFGLTKTCCDGAAELSRQGRLPHDGVSKNKTRYDLFEVKLSSVDRRHCRQTQNLTVPDIGQAQIATTAELLNEQIILRQGICFVGIDIKLPGAEICGHALHRKVNFRKNPEPEKIRNSCPLKVYKYYNSYEIKW